LPLLGTDVVREGKNPAPGRVVLLAGLCIVGLLVLLCGWPHQTGWQAACFTTQPQPGFQAPPLFQAGENRSLSFVLSGEQQGYLQPCGCSRPQLGGLVRRYNFMESLRTKGWPVVAVDLGDIAAGPDESQSPAENHPLLYVKYRYSMKALNLLGYSAIGVGEAELSMPLEKAIGEFRLNSPRPSCWRQRSRPARKQQFHQELP